MQVFSVGVRIGGRRRAHFAAMGERLVRGFAVGADEDLELHAHVLEAHFVFVRASCASFVCKFNWRS